MNDLITAATSGLFVEIGKVIEHMKAQQERIADLERQLAEASAPAVEQPIQWTYGPNVWKDWCTQYFGPDADDTYLAKAVFNLPPMAQKFKDPAAPQAAEADKVRLAEAWMTEDGERVVTNRTMEGAKRDGGAMLSSMAPYSVALVRAASMAAQAPVREVPGWLPIEGAPKDGSEVLLWLPAPYSQIAKARWFDRWKNWQEGEFPSDHDEYCGIGSGLPTLYQPLPAAPVQQEGV